MVTENKDAMLLAVQTLFKITRTQGRLVLMMVQHELVPRERVGLSTKCFDVHITYTRRALAKFGLTIITLWGYGYQLSAADRRLGDGADSGACGTAGRPAGSPGSRDPFVLDDDHGRPLPGLDGRALPSS